MDPVDRYLTAVPEPQRTTLNTVRRALAAILPTAEQCISYGMPAFKVDGTAVAGFAAFKNHCSYFPHSGQVLPALAGVLKGYAFDKGTLRFAPDTALPPGLLRKLVQARLKLESEKQRGGKVRAFYPSGVVKSRGQIKDGKMHGEWKWYRKDGSLMRTGSFKLGERSGRWCTWDREEKLVKETRLRA